VFGTASRNILASWFRRFGRQVGAKALYESTQLVLVNSGEGPDLVTLFCGLAGYADRIPDLDYGNKPKACRLYHHS